MRSGLQSEVATIYRLGTFSYPSAIRSRLLDKSDRLSHFMYANWPLLVCAGRPTWPYRNRALWRSTTTSRILNSVLCM